jgi:L-ascorbate metabolism protein UlaG (beta-lactamase superfamily)
VSGVVLRHPGEPVIYIAGDSVWNDAVRDALRKHEPDVVVLNTGEATLLAEAHVILMGAQDVVRAHRAAPHAHIVAVHMEALNHGVVSRDRVRDLVREYGLQGQVSVPEDGELLVF